MIKACVYLRTKSVLKLWRSTETYFLSKESGRPADDGLPVHEEDDMVLRFTESNMSFSVSGEPGERVASAGASPVKGVLKKKSTFGMNTPTLGQSREVSRTNTGNVHSGQVKITPLPKIFPQGPIVKRVAETVSASVADYTVNILKEIASFEETLIDVYVQNRTALVKAFLLGAYARIAKAELRAGNGYAMAMNTNTNTNTHAGVSPPGRHSHSHSHAGASEGSKPKIPILDINTASAGARQSGSPTPGAHASTGTLPLPLPLHLSKALMMLSAEKAAMKESFQSTSIEMGIPEPPKPEAKAAAQASDDADDLMPRPAMFDSTCVGMCDEAIRIPYGENASSYQDYLFYLLCEGLLDVYCSLLTELRMGSLHLPGSGTPTGSHRQVSPYPNAFGQAVEEYEYLKGLILGCLPKSFTATGPATSPAFTYRAERHAGGGGGGGGVFPSVEELQQRGRILSVGVTK
jgi:hypothetical protein